jgi:hypothetical protein
MRIMEVRYAETMLDARKPAPRRPGSADFLELRGLEHFNPDWNRGLANPFRSMIPVFPSSLIGRRQ